LLNSRDVGKIREGKRNSRLKCGGEKLGKRLGRLGGSVEEKKVPSLEKRNPGTRKNKQENTRRRGNIDLSLGRSIGGGRRELRKKSKEDPKGKFG